MTQTHETRPVGSPDGFEKENQTSSIVSARPDLTPAQAEALAVAHALVDAGVPVFPAARNHGDTGPEFHYPSGWETWKPNHAAVDRWKPGMALCAVTGVAFDVIDTDPRNGGTEGRAELAAAGVMPPVFGVAETPSAGTHELIPRTHLAKGKAAHGVDLQAGDDSGQGRGFVFIAPTVRVSKHGPNQGQPVEYRWTVEPDLEGLSAAGTPTALVERIGRGKPTRRVLQSKEPAESRAASSDLYDEAEEWTRAAADQQIAEQLNRVRAAQAGEVNGTLGGAARFLGRFVAGGHLSEDEAAQALLDALEDGGVHSDEWNTRNRLGWTAAGVIGSAFAKAKDEPWTVAPDAPAGNVNPHPYDSQAWHAWEAAREAGARRVTDTRSAMMAEIRDSFLALDGLQSLPPARPLIKGVLDLESAAWLIGQPKGFKSFVAIDWACHVAAGLPAWHGHKVTGGDVWYVAAEGARGMAKRVQAWIRHHEAKPDRLRVRPMPILARGETNRHLSQEWAALVDLAEAERPSLIVLDTQARMTLGLEENSATDMGLWVQAVDRLKVASGGCVLVVHHTGRNNGDARGSNALDGAQDVEWKVDRKPHRLQLTLSCDARKDGDDSARLTFGMTVVPVGLDEDGEPVTSLVLGDPVEAAPEDDREGIRVLDALANEGRSLTNQEWIVRTLDVLEIEGQGMTPAALRAGVNGARAAAEPPLAAINDNTFKSSLARMVKDGRVFKRGARVSLTDPSGDA